MIFIVIKTSEGLVTRGGGGGGGGGDVCDGCVEISGGSHNLVWFAIYVSLSVTKHFFNASLLQSKHGDNHFSDSLHELLN